MGNFGRNRQDASTLRGPLKANNHRERQLHADVHAVLLPGPKWGQGPNGSYYFRVKRPNSGAAGDAGLVDFAGFGNDESGDESFGIFLPTGGKVNMPLQILLPVAFPASRSKRGHALGENEYGRFRNPRARPLRSLRHCRQPHQAQGPCPSQPPQPNTQLNGRLGPAGMRRHCYFSLTLTGSVTSTLTG